MFLKSKTYLSAVYVLSIVILINACSTTTDSIKFTQSEVKQIPSLALEKVMSSRFSNETITIKAKGLDGTGIVKGFADQEYVIVTDKDQKEVKVKTSDITEIQRIWQRTVPEDSSKKTKVSTADAVGETLIYTPLIPVAIGTAPFLRVMGLDALKNSEDEEKARLVYEGMSKQDLIQAIGEPMEKYHCTPKNANGSIDIWVYGKEQVLRGGRALFIDSDKGTVYHNSYDTTFFKDSQWLNCSQAENNTTIEQEK